MEDGKAATPATCEHARLVAPLQQIKIAGETKPWLMKDVVAVCVVVCSARTTVLKNTGVKSPWIIFLSTFCGLLYKESTYLV